MTLFALAVAVGGGAAGWVAIWVVSGGGSDPVIIAAVTGVLLVFGIINGGRIWNTRHDVAQRVDKRLAEESAES